MIYATYKRIKKSNEWFADPNHSRIKETTFTPDGVTFFCYITNTVAQNYWDIYCIKEVSVDSVISLLESWYPDNIGAFEFDNDGFIIDNRIMEM